MSAGPVSTGFQRALGNNLEISPLLFATKENTLLGGIFSLPFNSECEKFFG